MFADRTAQGILNHITGQAAIFASPSAYVALFTTAPTSDSGAGAVEVAGGNYARVATSSSTWNAATGSGPSSITSAEAVQFPTAANLAAPAAPALNAQSGGSLAAGAVYVKVTYVSAGGETVPSSEASVAVSLNQEVVVTSPSALAGATGYKVYAATSSGGEEVQNGGAAIAIGTNYTIISIATGGAAPPSSNTASWGTVAAFGLYDAASGGNLLIWDWLGNDPWLPCTISQASPAVFTAHAHGYSASDNVAYTTVFGGAAPTFSQSNLAGVLAVGASPGTDTFTVTNGGTAVNTSATGDGMVRKVVTQAVVAGVQPSFAAGQLALNAA
ncbi:MAG TPA: hypothetical protein VJ770_21275 [Stellaceae bacterium]|nr:hypothetical protein [Stellaceae bacterium]